MNLFFLQIKVLLLRPCRVLSPPPPLLPAPPHSSLCCWQSHMVTSHLPDGPLPWALPGPEGAVQGFHLCAGCRTGGTRRISPTPSWVARGPLLLPIVKCLKCNAPPSLAEGRLSWHRGSQTGHQGHTEKANSLPVASPSTLGDQIYLMVKGLAGLAARISKSWGPPCALVPLLGRGQGRPSCTVLELQICLPHGCF